MNPVYCRGRHLWRFIYKENIHQIWNREHQERLVCCIDPWFQSLSKCSCVAWFWPVLCCLNALLLQILIFLYLEAAQRSALCSSLLCIWVLLPVSFLLIKQTQIFEVSCSAVFFYSRRQPFSSQMSLVCAQQLSCCRESCCVSFIPVCLQSLLWQQMKVLAEIGTGLQQCHHLWALHLTPAARLLQAFPNGEAWRVLRRSAECFL